MIVLVALFLISVVLGQQQASDVTGASGTTVFYRVAYQGVGAAFNFGGQANGIVALLRNANDNTQLAGSVTQPTGSDSVGSYVQVSFNDVNGFDQPPAVKVCFNSSTVLANQGGEICSSVLAQFGAGSSSTPLQRWTVTLQQNFQSNTPTCQTVGASCPTATVTTSSFQVATSTEALQQRDCVVGPVFLRGVAPTCPLRIVRSTNANLTVPTANGFTEQVALVFNPALAPTTFPVFNGNVPVALSLPRSPVTYVVDQGSSAAVGPLNGVAKRSWEIISTAAGTATVSVQATFFLKIVNAAHRELPNGQGGVAVDTSAIVVIQDQTNNNNVWHYQVVQRGATSQFIELPSISGGNLQITVYPGANTAGTVSVPSFFNGTFGTGFVQTTLSNSGNVLQNTYQLLAITGTSSGTSYALTIFDVTPSTANTQGSVEEQVINLITPTNSLDNSAAVTLPQLNLFTTLQLTGSFSCANQYSFTSSPQSKSGFSNGQHTLTTSSSCCGATSLATVNLGGSFATCGKRVTLLIGRPFTVSSPSCQGPSGNICTFQNLSTPVLGLGGLDFVGNSFFINGPGSAFPAPLTFDIAACTCTPAVSTSCAPTCGESQILSSIASLSANVLGSSGSVSGSVSGLAGSINTVISKLTNINSTLISIKNLDSSIKNLVQKKC